MPTIEKIGDVNFSVMFEGLPDWAIPMIKIVPIFHTLDVYVNQLNDLTFIYDFNYLWEKLDNKNYLLKVRLSARLYDGGNKFPLYVDLKAYFFNSNRYEIYQHKK